MQRIEPPRVREGDRVTTSLFDQMRRAIRAARLIAGKGVRLRVTPSGTVISFEQSRPFSHPWRVAHEGTTAARIEVGSINSVPATISGKPLNGGKESAPPPVLKWSRTKLDDDGRGYIAAECTFDPAQAWRVAQVEIVQVADCDTDDGSPSPGLPNTSGGALPLTGGRARYPLAMLRERKSGALDVFQIAFISCSHRVKFAADQTTPSRHFFYT